MHELYTHLYYVRTLYVGTFCLSRDYFGFFLFSDEYRKLLVLTKFYDIDH